MGVLSIMNELRSRMNAQWGNTTDVAWPNVAYTPTVGTPWVRLSVNVGTTFVVDIGSPQKTHRTVGTLYLQVFTPDNRGDAEGLNLAEQLVAIFNNWCGVQVRCRACTVKPIGKDAAGDDWFQVNVVTPFVHDELI